VQVVLAVSGDDAAEGVRALDAWLAGEDQLRGRVRQVIQAPEPAAMGSVPDVLMVALGQGGVATALVSVLIAWIRRQTGTASVTAKRSDGAEFTLSADHVRGLTVEEIRALVSELSTALDGDDAGSAG
jgi:hypothetical protein